MLGQKKAERRLHLVLARCICYCRSPGQRKGDTQSLTICIFPAQWQCWEHRLQLSITPRKHLHKDAVIFNVHLKASSRGALRAVKEFFRAVKQPPPMKAYAIINRLIYGIQLWKAISGVKWMVNTRHPSKKESLTRVASAQWLSPCYHTVPAKQKGKYTNPSSDQTSPAGPFHCGQELYSS